MNTEQKIGGGGSLPPFIKGVFDKLPEPDSAWPIAARKKWLQTAAHSFDLMYTDPGDGATTLTVEVKDSAK